MAKRPSKSAKKTTDDAAPAVAHKSSTAHLIEALRVLGTGASLQLEDRQRFEAALAAAEE